MKKYILILATALAYANISINLYSQIHLSGQIPTLTTPEAAEIQKYASYPMNYSTGLPNITIPLHEIKVGDIALPINLTYHSSGLKPNDAPGRIATGWTLNAEPAISVKVNGFHDASPNGYYDGGNAGTYPGELLYNKKVADGEIDVLPDFNFYRLADKSGMFVIKGPRGSNTYIAQPHSMIEIKGGPNNFQVLDENGLSYDFGGTGYMDVYRDTKIPYRLLCKSISSSMTKAKITFSYGYSGLNENGVSGYSFNDAVTIEAAGENSFIVSDNKDGMQRRYLVEGSSIRETYDGWDFNPFVKGTRPTPSTEREGLQKITFDNGSVVFLGENRSIIPDLGCNIYIQVRDNINPSNPIDGQRGEIIKEILLYCSKYRKEHRIDLSQIKLDSVVIRTPKGERQTYSFEYLNENLVPEMGSGTIDFWGFCNGYSNSYNISSRVPSFTYRSYTHKGNRDVNHLYTQAGILGKIYSPTGAITSFEYEGNESGIQMTYYDGKEIPGTWIWETMCTTPKLCVDIPIGGLRVRRITEEDLITGKKTV